jgi:hypothetical protein
MLTLSRVVIPCVVAAFAASCGDDESRRSLSRDAASLNEIVANAPRLQLVEDLRLDANLEDFSSVSRVYVGPHDEILVPLPQDQQLRIYDKNGTRIASVGRRGSGPGEFQSVGIVGAIADTFWVSDIRQRRITYVASDGAVLRTSAIPQRVLRDTSGSVIGQLVMFSPLAIYGDGSMLGETRARPSSGSDGITPRAAAIMIPDEDAQVLFFPPSFEDPRWMMEAAGFGQSVPFTMSPQMSWSPTGDRLATLHTDTVTEVGGALRLVVYEISDPRAAIAQAALWRPTHARSITYQGEPIPQEAVDSALAAFIPESGRPTEGPADLPRRFQAMARERMPAVFPPVVRLRLGLDDTIWLDLRPSRDGKMSLILDRNGQPIGTVVVPTNVTISQSNRSYAYALERDDVGLASVVRYRIVGLN